MNARAGAKRRASWRKTACFFMSSMAVVLFASGCRSMSEGCTAVAGPEILYPQPGATGIADPHLVLWFASNGDPSPSFSRPVISPNGGGQAVRGGAYASPSPGPLPSGAATPRPDEQVFVSAIPTYAPATTYNVIITGGCGSGSVGTFSTK
jgi:hypothetical protein